METTEKKKRGPKFKYDWSSLEIGESLKIDNENDVKKYSNNVPRCVAAAYQWARNHRIRTNIVIKFKYKTNSDGSIIIERIS